MTSNIILTTDSYKASHWKQYPPDTKYVSSYIESRGGKWDYTLFFGLQMFIREYLMRAITAADIDEAEEFWQAHGEPFNREGWQYILDRHEGHLPVSIEAVPEGTLVPTGNVLVQIINTDPKVPWLTSYLETALLRGVWYPTTVATNSWACRRIIYRYLSETADDPDAEIGFKLHDFGARGVSSHESAMIGGAAHLVNFMGTDTVEGILAARKYYDEPMAGFSIPAAEHSTQTCFGGAAGEIDAFRNMLDQFAGKYPLVAVVSDSYDIYNAAENLWGSELLAEVRDSGSTIVVRPDSGDPTEVPVRVIETLMEKAGYTVNSKGYKVLPDYFRVIQGDGIDIGSLEQILSNMKDRKLSASNIAFGMGGGLLQQVDRDTMRFAMKCSAIKVAGEWRDVWKDPVTDSGKASKRGRLKLMQNEDGFWRTVRRSDPSGDNRLRTVYEDGRLKVTDTFADIRRRAGTIQ